MNVQVVVVIGVVVADQSGHLLKIVRFELDRRDRLDVVRLHPAGQQALAKGRTQGFAAVKAQETRARLQAGPVFRYGYPQCLEVDVQFR